MKGKKESLKARTTTVHMGPRTLGTILAALRYWQKHMAGGIVLPDGDLEDVATDGGDWQPLTAEEIDELCQEMNCGGGEV